MNFRSEQFRSLADRKREADLCSYYGNVNLPAVKAAKEVAKPKESHKHSGFEPRQE